MTSPAAVTAPAPEPEAGPEPRWHTTRRRVAWTDTDPSGAYQFTAALRYAEDAEVAMLRDLGVLDLLYPHLPRVSLHANYARPCYFEELLDVDVRVSRLGHSSLDCSFRLRATEGTKDTESVRASGTIVSVHLDGTGRAAPFPDQARAALQAAFPDLTTAAPAEAQGAPNGAA